MRIVLYTLGGTIAMAGAGGRGVVARLGGAELTAAVPGLAEIGVQLAVQDTEPVPSADLTFRRIAELVAAADTAVREGAAGVVVTQGTDTLEETCYLADLLWDRDEPLVFTGAMRNPTLAGPDGPANLLAAVRVATSDAARGLGALAVLDDEIHAARFVRKAHATATGAFTSPDAGPIGHVIEGAVRVLTRPARLPALTVDPAGFDRARVGLYTATLDDDGGLLAGLADRYQGLVVAGYGVGHVPGALAPVLGTVARSIPVVLTSRTGGGSVLAHTYGAVGSEADLARRGLLNGGLLSPYRARVLLRTLLAAGADGAAIEAQLAARR
ncbi:L-asparaginase [Actinocatenispora thailandica]|uniref:L-asparaginase n=1 Tax=Actinocatenispora thailandica TaxID=227318 RepID=A0A7R7DRP5_9ACTN|nr:asparaginase [Actinocatenispora thailandica]BCJ36613.1 L-asparaginase [Actinocatenispora thailandica]